MFLVNCLLGLQIFNFFHFFIFFCPFKLQCQHSAAKMIGGKNNGWNPQKHKKSCPNPKGRAKASGAFSRAGKVVFDCVLGKSFTDKWVVWRRMERKKMLRHLPKGASTKEERENRQLPQMGPIMDMRHFLGCAAGLQGAKVRAKVEE